MNDRTYKTLKGAMKYAHKLNRYRATNIWVVQRGEAQFQVTDINPVLWKNATIVWTNA